MPTHENDVEHSYQDWSETHIDKIIDFLIKKYRKTRIPIKIAQVDCTANVICALTRRHSVNINVFTTQEEQYRPSSILSIHSIDCKRLRNYGFSNRSSEHKLH